ncbi:ankyrin repeat and SOCS box protein 12-like [Saccoglossus kowalevskii]|uniref:Ankyrin repeat and SOCS box protein 1-like n=1 Tax=Saccoglossus kowalevskii TaxID=10224 RepID=A0ABM0GNB8_SACKO|nr:PREDICTED: ankyrin repeat and SOCS box protein 1-like [Saccoglossus kowalevskii]
MAECKEGDDEYSVWPIHDRDSLLHQAAYIGHLKKLQNCLQDKKFLKMINSKNRLGCTPLRLAATKGNTECVKCLLKHGAKVDIPDMKAQTPLFMAVQNNQVECVKLLLEAKANYNGDSSHLCTPLYIAAMRGSLECIKSLLSHGADANSSQIVAGSFNSTPLYISFTYHHYECFKWLLCTGADPNFGLRKYMPHTTITTPTLFNVAVRRRDKVWIQLLVDFNACMDLNDDNLRKLHNYCDNEKDFIEYLRQIIYSPRLLQSQCRLLIRNTIGKNRFHLIDRLPLPTKLIDYLLYNEW